MLASARLRLLVFASLACLPSCRDERPLAAARHGSASGSPAVSATSVAATASVAAPTDARAGDTGDAERPFITLAFVGDVAMSLHVGRYVSRRARGEPVPAEVAEGFPFTAVRDRIRAADLAIGNLECVIPSRAQRVSPNTPLLAPPESAALLRDSGFDVLSVANNHIFDFGALGFRETLAHLDGAGLTPIGAGIGNGRPEKLLIRQVQGVRVGLLAWYVRGMDHDVALAQVLQADREVDSLVVYLHWGTEGASDVLAGQRQLAHDLIDSGADLVVGAHAHVLQGEEWYRDRLIVYGLGNFVFSGMGFERSHRIGGYLEVDLDETRIRGRRLWRVMLDDLGAPQWLDERPVESW